MGKLKDQLDKNKFTLTASEIDHLQRMAFSFQQSLDLLQQNAAASFLNQVAISRFGFDPKDELRFDLDMSKSKDNLTITDVAIDN